MTFIRFLMITMAVMAGMLADNYAGCGASKQFQSSAVRSRPADQNSAQAIARKRSRMRRAVSCVAESLNFYYKVRQEGLHELDACAAVRFIESGLNIVRYQIEGQTVAALVESGLERGVAADLVWQARSVSSANLELQSRVYGGENA